MDAARYQTIIQALQQKTIANGCTPQEARAAAARVILLRLRYGRMEVSPDPSTQVTEADAWTAQFELTPWLHAPKRTWIDNLGQGLRIIMFMTAACLAVILFIGIKAAIAD